MKRFLSMALAAVLLCAAQAQAQVVVGGAVGATQLVTGGHVLNLATTLAELEYQSDLTPYWKLGLVSFAGINSEGGGPETGMGLRVYRKAFNSETRFGLGVSGFALGENTPEISELSIFIGPELLLELPFGLNGNRVTGLLGVYPSAIGQSNIVVIRPTVRASFN